MITASRRWFRRNRTNLAIGVGVVGAGYLAGQYVLGKIQEARQRMSEDKTAKEKYAHIIILTVGAKLIDCTIVSDGDSSRIKTTARIPSSPFSPPSATRFSELFPSNRSPSNCSKRGRIACDG